MPAGGRVVVLAVTMTNAGTPHRWAARATAPGVSLLSDFSDDSLAAIASQVRACRRAADIVVLSVHWGANWGYALEPGQQRFAQRLIDDAGVDVVYGHSSHHVKGIECHRGKLILYGCGDFVNDYEGIAGQENYAPDLALMIFASLRCGDDEGAGGRHGQLAALELVPLRRRRLRLERAGDADTRWLADRLDREGRGLGTRVARGADGVLRVACA